MSSINNIFITVDLILAAYLMYQFAMLIAEERDRRELRDSKNYVEGIFTEGQ